MDPKPSTNGSVGSSSNLNFPDMAKGLAGRVQSWAGNIFKPQPTPSVDTKPVNTGNTNADANNSLVASAVNNQNGLGISNQITPKVQQVGPPAGQATAPQGGKVVEPIGSQKPAVAPPAPKYTNIGDFFKGTYPQLVAGEDINSDWTRYSLAKQVIGNQDHLRAMENNFAQADPATRAQIIGALKNGVFENDPRFGSQAQKLEEMAKQLGDVPTPGTQPGAGAGGGANAGAGGGGMLGGIGSWLAANGGSILSNLPGMLMGAMNLFGGPQRGRQSPMIGRGAVSLEKSDNA